MRLLAAMLEKVSSPKKIHLFDVGDKVVYTNDFGMCWGVKTITAQCTRTYDLWGVPEVLPTYHYEGSETPWFSVPQKNFTKATKEDLVAHDSGDTTYFQKKYGFKLDDLFGC